MSPTERAKPSQVFAFLALALAFLFVPLAAHAQTLPPGFEEDLVTNNDFENSATALGFAPVSTSDGSVAHSTTDPIAGTGSLRITVNSYGRVVRWHAYGWESGPFARSVTVAAKLRVDSSTIAGRQLQACAIAYYQDSPNPEQVCQNFPVAPSTVANVRLSLDTNDRQLLYAFPQFKLDNTGTIEATVDDVHYYVDYTDKPSVPSGFELDDVITSEFENSEDLELEPFSEYDGTVAHTTTNPILGPGSLKITVNSYGRVSGWKQYGWGSGPDGRSVTFSAMLRVDSSTISGRELTACSVAYFMDSQDPEQVCQNFPVDPDNFVDVYLSLDTEDRQLLYVFPQFKLNDTGVIEATVDEVHFYVLQPQ